MAIHMDDPPWDIFGLPRLLVDEPSIDRFLKMVDDEYNCLTLCSGSLNANPDNNVAEIIRKHCGRIAFAHIRNVKHFENGDFSEASHRDCDGDTGILDIMKAYHDCGFKGYIRPDHGRHLWGEGPGTVRPGYGLYDRALGIMYMLGVWDCLEKESKKELSSSFATDTNIGYKEKNCFSCKHFASSKITRCHACSEKNGYRYWEEEEE